MSSNYEVNRLTGQCVEKSEQVSDIIWKDIFRLELNGYNQKNGILYTGPYFRLRGITNSQINSKHAFLIYLSLKIKTTLRNLENDEDIILQSICEIKNGVEESTDDINIVEYECFSNNTNNTNLTNYELNEIEEGENEGLLKKSNINELLKNIGLNNMLNDKPNFQLQDLMKYIIFEINNITNQTSENYIFNFQIEGKLNKEINNENIDIDLELNEIEDKINCKFIVENNITGILNCLLDINNYKNKTYFTFKASEIKTEKNNTIYFSKLNEIWLINPIEDEIYKENRDNNEEINDEEINENEIIGTYPNIIDDIDTYNNDENLKDTDKNNLNNDNITVEIFDRNTSDKYNLDLNVNNTDDINHNNEEHNNDDNQINDEHANTSENKKNDIGMIIGCVIGGFTMIGGLIFLGYYLSKRKNKQNSLEKMKYFQKIGENKDKNNITIENYSKSNEAI